jgi:hypothetical protein
MLHRLEPVASAFDRLHVAAPEYAMQNVLCKSTLRRSPWSGPLRDMRTALVVALDALTWAPCTFRTRQVRSMSKFSAIFNATLYLAFCFLVASGFVLEFRLESTGELILGLARRDMAKVHAILALGFVTIAALHLGMNGAWIRAAFARARWTTASVAAIGLLLVALAMLAPVAYGMP